MPINTKSDGSGGRWTTAAKRVGAIVTVTIAGAAAIVFNSGTTNLNALDTSAGYNQYANDTQLDVTNSGAGGVYNGWHNPDFTEVPADNKGSNGTGPGGQGQFRIFCTPSHYGYDDPIIFPGEPGAAHLHMFWGNTEANADTVFNGNPGDNNDPHDIMNNGGSTCQGGALNRSAYWMPAMLSGPAGTGRQIVRPETILLYYKSNRPHEVQPLPPGVQLLAGNINPGGSTNPSFSDTTSNGPGITWGCYNPATGLQIASVTTIPTDCTAQGFPTVQATIQFPQCLATSDGTITGDPILTSTDFISHTVRVNPNFACPSTHPYRVPQISYLVRWIDDPATVSAWRLSSDQDHMTANPPFPGGSLHGDWLGGWNDDAIQAWIDGCFDPDTNPVGGLFTNQGINNFGGPQNCSNGQTGLNQHWFNTGGDINGTQGTGEARNFNRVTGSNKFGGPFIVADPDPDFMPIG